MRFLFLVTTLAILNGCGISEELDAINLENHKKICNGYGYTQGTDAYATCLMKLDEQEDADEQRMLDRESRKKK
ncbi:MULTISPECIES: hypothetical protein [Serratia]|uniref:hypothetical protein n=1 Tax=Serratia TaxID=613 RepID=UPI0013DC16FC|nr:MULTISPECIES: hypothetical protein [Serratia]MBH2656238.1 hypothetical protein [Serratia ureilytica]MBJ2092160.1 hypothetical protein [Serratia ureilytica]HBC5194928.1 hypothetical protein [Serratia marcescens]